MIKRFVNSFSRKARQKRAEIFLSCFNIDENTKILDLGSESGSAINLVLRNTNVNPANVYIADIDNSLLMKGHNIYGYTPVLINESKNLPFPDMHFDIVYSSSVIEHVTLPKDEIWNIRSTSQFRKRSFTHQKKFADEIRRISKKYFVQTPNKYYIIESHSWLPFVGYLPRFILLPLLRTTNKFWIKKTQPDWNLLTKNEIQKLFPESKIIIEKSLGLSKSIMAIKNS